MMKKILHGANVPIYCEHCGKEVEQVWICRMDSIIGIRYALLCGRCQKLIGIYSPIDSIEKNNYPNNFSEELELLLN